MAKISTSNRHVEIIVGLLCLSSVLLETNGQTISVSQPLYTLTAPNCNPGTVVGSISATDSSNHPVYYFIPSPNNNVAVNVRTGALILINYIRPNTPYSIQIKALSSSGTVTANVTYSCVGSGTGPAFPSSGFPSSFGSTSSSSVSFTETLYTFATSTCAPGEPLGRTSVQEVTGCSYSLISSGPFFVVPSTGVVMVSGQLSGTETYTGVATARCGAASATARVIISTHCRSSLTTTTTPSSALKFTQNVFNFSTSSCSPGITVGMAAATNAVAYVLSPTSADFAIQQTSGLITSTSTLTEKSYTLTAQAYGASGNSTTATIVVSSPKCNTALEFTKPQYTFSPTNCNSDANVGQVALVGNPPGVTYSIDNPTGVYNVNGTTGTLTAVGVPVVGTLTIRASRGSRSATVPVTISTSSCPASSSSSETLSFNKTIYMFTPTSCAAGDILGTVTATSTSGSPIIYSISSGNQAVQVTSTTTGANLTPFVTIGEGNTSVIIMATDASGKTATSTAKISCPASNSR
ncbi:hypothetical protein RvY_15489 [Ramazzottius varieornatus]|uniref:Fibronectin type-III domain-containing protein n=1 Tax=Ramazzottius varieornatus TaxID=947166 RepID=A0A1D1VWB5_RAMVA|nr:hypothetical protein RvY_15489 [Ramazzottius varieornatus]